ncbi:large subunit ribosomal protein L18 [Symbiobacterium terraclitae]|uniref:Large ribosomal subunit protein uL18 n=1 Tax=Symbiobacterium terraclitae TaxID=557451 RepID=A0ABS4JN22_9FIRM|nr:50S ribosomal protein L18 [Symbiobacterium terraclitae]MBP2016929.1 large subunit ribosomal protein L18 [Symbiobacterium terraclitae]
MIVKQDRNKARRVRQLRVRKTVHGTPERPRLNVFRSNQNIYAQVIDDTVGKTLVSASTLDPEVKARLEGNGGNKAAAAIVGEVVAKRALAAGVTKVVFDRAGYLYHGRVAALAEAAREAGLEF